MGAMVFDLPRYLPSYVSKSGWLKARNRTDLLTMPQGQPSVTCTDESSSDLHACHVFPRLGKHLMRAALKQWPINFDNTPFSEDKSPHISFVIPHRGMERLPQLIATIHSVRAQREVNVECLVVEQDQDTIITGLPAGVRHIHLPDPSGATAWQKSWAFNTGIREAAADIVVCHDGDILVPADYGRQIAHHMSNGSDVVHLQRFLFCLDENTTSVVLHGAYDDLLATPERVRQNWQGGTLAIRKSCYHQIGGFDERFRDWSGEDREFYDRCRTLNGCRRGYLPFVHLWHPEQSAKHSTDREQNLAFTHKVFQTPREQRIQQLKSVAPIDGFPPMKRPVI